MTLFKMALATPLWLVAAFCLVGSACFLLVSSTLARRRQAQVAAKLGCKPPTSVYPHVPFLFGLDFRANLFKSFANHRLSQWTRHLYETLGKTFTTRVLNAYAIHTVDGNNLRALHLTNFDDFTIIPARRKLVSAIYGKGVFAAEGKDWEHSRYLVRHGLNKLLYGQPLFEKHVTHTLNSIRESEDSTVDFDELAAEFTIRLASDLYLGEDADDGSSDSLARLQFVKDFRFMSQVGRDGTVLVRRILAGVYSYISTFTQTKRRAEKYVDEKLHQAAATLYAGDLKGEDQRPTTMAEALSAKVDDVKRSRIEIFNLLLAGNDTISLTLAETIWLLARTPGAWSKLRAEVQREFGAQPPALAELKKTSYLVFVIKEGIRCRPTLAVHGRLAVRDTSLPRGGGPSGQDPLFVPRGTVVNYSNYALYRDPAVFGADVDEFRPERWDGLNPDRYEYLAFGAGPRVCPGEKLAWAVTGYALARLAQEFEVVEPADDRPWVEAQAFSFFNKHGVHVRFR